jgi:hypothetical protein
MDATRVTVEEALASSSLGMARLALQPPETGVIVRLAGSSQEWRVESGLLADKLLRWVTYAESKGWEPVEDPEWAAQVRQRIKRIS